MKVVYLLADCQLDRMFGFNLEQSLIQIPKGISYQEMYIKDKIKAYYNYSPKIKKIFLIENNKGRGICGKVDIHSKKRLGIEDVSPKIKTELRLKEDYLTELKNYILENNEYDKIIIANSKISNEIKSNLESLTSELKFYLKTPGI